MSLAELSTSSATRGFNGRSAAGQLARHDWQPFWFAEYYARTVGIISALGRVLPVDSDDPQEAEYTIPDIIQTDAPINLRQFRQGPGGMSGIPW